MRTRNSYFPNSSSVTIPRRRNKRRTLNVVEPELRTIVEVAPMTERAMEELLQAPTEGYGEAIVIPKINADHFEIKMNLLQLELLQAPTEGYGEAIVIPKINADHFEIKMNLLQLVQVNPYHGFERENPHTHINNFKRITSTLKFRDVPNDVIKLMMFPYSLKGSARICNTIPNSKGEMKAITTRSGVAYEGPSIPIPTKVVKRETEETTDKEQTNFQGSTAHIQPPVTLILEPDVSKTLPKPNIPYPSRLNDQKLREKAMNQMENSFKSFKIFTSTLDKLFELAKIPLNENCSAMLLKKLPKNLGDPGKFLIPCDFMRMDVCYAFVDLGASINLMPLSIWKKLSLPGLTPTQMTLELADRSITRPKGVAEDDFVKVGKFHFPTDFVVVDFEADPRVPLILGRSFLRIGRALIDIYGEEITLRVNDEAVTFNLNQTTRYSSTYDDLSVNRIDIIDVSREEYAQEILGFSNNSSSGNPTSTSELIIFDSSPSLTLFEGSDFILKEIKAYLMDESISSEIDHADCDPEGDKCLIEKFPWVSPIHYVPKKGGITVVENENNKLIPTRLVTGWRVCIDYRKLNDATHKDHFPLPFMDQMLEQLAGNEFYYFLDGFSSYFQIPINPSDQENTTFTCPYGTFAYSIMPFGLYNAPGTFQRCMMAIFHDMIEKTMEVFIDDFSVFGDSFSSCLSHLDTMLQWCEDTNLVLNWEKCHFMVKEGIFLGHKISKNGLEFDRAKVDVIAKLPHPMTVKGVRSFLKHAGFYRLIIQDFSKIARPMTHLLEKETPFVFSKDCIDAFETLKKKLTEASILVVPDWNLPFELMCDASDFAIGVILGQ
nr:reverse transcriptase domain-containing protein [Tanacetum cinerariifolium]